MTKQEINYSTKELTNLLLKHNNIHDGHWILNVNFGFSATNIHTSSENDEVNPAGVVALQQIGLQPVPEPLPFSLDASVENPRPKRPSRKNNLAIPE